MKVGGPKDNWLIAKNVSSAQTFTGRVVGIESRKVKGQDWPVIHLLMGTDQWLVSGWALSSKEEIEVAELIGKEIELIKKNDSCFHMNVQPPISISRV